jgi:hypothetical protein
METQEAYYLSTLLNMFGASKDDLKTLSSREEWAKVLSVTERTIYNWEREIVDSSISLVRILYWGNRKNRKKLDFYQKFFLMMIAWCQEVHSICEYADIRDWIGGTDESGKKKILALKREVVESWLFS